jgi:starch synthase
LPASIEKIRLKPVDSNASEVALYAIRRDEYFGRAGLYQEAGRDYPDNLDRFAFFCRAALELADAWEREEQWVPDVLHVHDWQAGLIPVYLKTHYTSRPFAARARTVMTLHNVGYQGIFPAAQYPALGLERNQFTPGGLEFYGSINLLKGGILAADFLTTVSPTYCHEIQTPEYGFGLDGVFRERKDRLVGIVNGLDTEVWNPATDRWLPANYSIQDWTGKTLCKASLQRECGLPVEDVPLLAVVSRLVAQKGIDLVIDAVPAIVAGNAQLVVLGTGEAQLEEDLSELQKRHGKQVKVHIGFDEGLAHRIQAGADMFLVPSRYEPCGLTQLCSLRYGAVPIVRKTGGLADTVIDSSGQNSSPGRGTGFMFDAPTSRALTDSINLALSKYAEESAWIKLMQRGMRTDVGWQKSAKEFVDLYRAVIKS